MTSTSRRRSRKRSRPTFEVPVIQRGISHRLARWIPFENQKRRKRSRNYKERPDSKRRQLEKQGPNWLDLPRDIVECIIGHLHWTDRSQLRAVCKAWSDPNCHIPTIDKVPWAMTSFGMGRPGSTLYGMCRLLDPFSREYVVRVPVRENQHWAFQFSRPHPSVYGWILFEMFEKKHKALSLFSPFTFEVIKLPELEKFPAFQVATFSLNASSPKCVIFVLCMGSHKIYVKICSPSDYSWKTFEFNGFEGLSYAIDAIYAHGVFYCVFAGGQLGTFNVELEEWTILTDNRPLEFNLRRAELIVSDGDILLLDRSGFKSPKLYKFGFSKMSWVYENNLNNHVLFIGYTSFSAPAVGETSQLANSIFNCKSRHYPVRCYDSTSLSCSESLLYRNCVDAAKRALAWIEFPYGGIWRADDLINAG